MGSLRFEEAYELFAQQIRAGAEAGADLIAIETMTDLYEAKAALLAAKENCDLPVFVTMTFEQDGRTFTGCSVPAMALTLQGLGADAIGINCSLGPKQIYSLARTLVSWTTLPVIIKPNAGLPTVIDGRTAYDLSPAEFGRELAGFLDLGISIMGGCCGSNPEFIRELCRNLEGKAPDLSKRVEKVPPAVCSNTEVVPIDQVRVIGERINPTGKKLFKQALLNGDMDYIVKQGIDQAEAGADILVAHMGLTTKGSIGAETALTLDDCCVKIRAIIKAGREVNPDIMVICHGGPIADPEDAAYVIRNVPEIDGFFGASSIERLASERGMTAQTKAFKTIQK